MIWPRSKSTSLIRRRRHSVRRDPEPYVTRAINPAVPLIAAPSGASGIDLGNGLLEDVPEKEEQGAKRLVLAQIPA